MLMRQKADRWCLKIFWYFNQRESQAIVLQVYGLDTGFFSTMGLTFSGILSIFTDIHS